MPNMFHKDYVDDNNHAITARTYADITARDADTTFNTDATNINKTVRVDSPLAFFTLVSIGPAVFISLGAADPIDTFLELSDTPGNYSGAANQVVSVNAGETGLEFTNIGIDDVLAIGQVLTAPRTLNTGSFGLDIGTGLGTVEISSVNGAASSQIQIINSQLRFFADNGGGGEVEQIMFQNGNWQIDASGNYIFGDSIGGNLPVINSDTNDAILHLGAGNGHLGRASVFAFRSLSASGAPVDGTTVAWFVGQLYIDTATSIEYHATSKSSNPDSAGTGSVWVTIEPAIAPGDVFGPGSATNNALARFDTTTGKLIQNSLALLSDLGLLSGIIALNIDTGGDLQINSVSILDATTLGSSVVNSSLTSVGTIGTGIWQGTPITEIFGGTNQTSYLTGDILFASAANTLAKLAIGSTNQLLSVVGGVPVWINPSAGNVIGPASATDNAVALFNGTTGKIIKDSVSLTFDIAGQQLSLPDGSILLESLEFGDSTRQSSGVPLVDINWTVTDIRAINTQDLSAEIDVPRSLDISRDGLKLYVGDNTSQSIFEYDMGAPFDLSTAPVFTGNSIVHGANFTGGRIKPDGTRFYVMSFSGDFREYPLSTPFDLSTAGSSTLINTAASAVNAFFVSDDGRDLFFGDNVGVITHWTMSVPWDFSTLFDTGTSFSSGLSWLNGAGLSFRSDGRKIILSDGPNSAFVEYSLDIPWDITTLRFIKSQVVGTANYGELFISPDGEKAYSMGITSDLIREFQLFAGITGYSKIAPTTVEVFSAADLDDLATAFVITVADGENLTIDLKADLIFSTTRFVLEGSAELRLVSMNADAEWGFTGGGTFISGDAFRVSIENLVLFATVTEDFVNLTSGDLSVQNTAIIGFDSLGSMVGNSFVLRFSDIIDIPDGMDLVNCRLDAINARFINTPTTGPAFRLASVVPVAHDLDLNILDMPPGTSLVRYDPGNASPGVLNASINTINNGNLFDTSGGSTGTFTAVSDAAITITPIISVSDAGDGTARFNLVPDNPLYPGQEFTISGFVTNTAYNGTFIAKDAATGFFEIAQIPFGTDEASGSFLVFSVIVTDTGTTLSDGDTLVLDTDGSSDYDGGAVVYAQDTNDFQINRTFTQTRSGTWDTAGVDQTDPRVLAFQNPGFAASQYVATAFVNDNSTDVGTIVNNTFKDAVFGTGGSALVAGSTIERWKIINDVLGIFEYMGNEPFSGYITFDFTVTSSGGNVEFRFKWQKDTGGGFADLTNDVEALVDVGSDAQSITKTFPITALNGDRIKPVLTRNSGSSGLVIRYATIFASQNV